MPLDGFFEGPFQTGIGARRAARRDPSADRCRPAPRARTGSSHSRRRATRSSAWPPSSRSAGGVDQPRPRRADRGRASTPYRAKAVEAALARAATGRPAAVAAAAEHATDGQTVNGDIHADRDYRTAHGRRLHPPRDRGRARALAPPSAGPSHRACGSSGSPRAGARPARLAGAVLARDLTVGGAALVEGPAADAPTTCARSPTADPGRRRSRVLVLEAGRAPRGRRGAPAGARRSPAPASTMRGPAQSRVDLAGRGRRASLNVRIAELERLNRIDPLEVFTAFDGQVVDARRPRRERQGRATRRRRRDGRRRARGWPASAATRSSGSRRSCRAGSGSSSRSRVRASGPRAVRGERPRQGRGARLGRSSPSTTSRTTPTAVEAALAALRPPARPGRPHPDRRRGQHRPARRRASSRSTALGGRVVRRGVPAHPGSMLWLARIGGTAILGPADLRRLLEGDRRGPAPAAAAVRRAGRSERTVAKLGHGGILTRSQRFRFPAYARELDAPDG